MDPRGGLGGHDDDGRGSVRLLQQQPSPPRGTTPVTNEGDGGDGDYDGGGGIVAAGEDRGDGDGVSAEGYPDSARYRRGDRVYARDDSSRRGVYEATIREVEHRCHRRDEGEDGDLEDDHHRRYTYRYLVHYLGWNKKWDRWVDEDDVMDIDSAEGREAAERLREEDRVAKERDRAKREQKRENKKRKRQQQLAKQQASVHGDGDGDDDDEMCEEEVEMPSPLHDLPFTLRTILIDDRENITRRCHQPSEAEWYVGRLLYNLPAPVTVKAALERFLSDKEKKLLLDRDKLRRKEKGKGKEKDPLKEKEKDPQENESVDEKRKVADERDGNTFEKDGGGTEEPGDSRGGGRQDPNDDCEEVMRGWRDTVEGLLDLFDLALPLALLYEQERLQYASTMRSIHRRATAKGAGAGACDRQQHPRPCEMYGCEHLLRLFVRLSAMIAAARFASTSAASTTGPPNGGGDDDDDGGGIERRRQKPSTSPASEVLTMMEGIMVERLEDVIRYLQGNVARVFRPSYREPHERELTSAERALRERAGRKRARLLREREGEKKKGDEEDVGRASVKKGKAGGEARTASKSSR